jgi:hypothetical protein
VLSAQVVEGGTSQVTQMEKGGRKEASLPCASLRGLSLFWEGWEGVELRVLYLLARYSAA